MARSAAGVHGASDRMARRPTGSGSLHAAPGRMARPNRDLRGGFRRDGPRRPGGRRAAHHPAQADRARGERGVHAAGRERARVRAVPRHVRRRPGERVRDAPADHARARRLHGASGGPVRGLLRSGARGARRVRDRPVDQPGGVGSGSMGDQPGVPTGARDGRPAHPVQARDARHGRRRRDVGDVHAEAVRRHHGIVVSPPPVVAQRERRQRVPRSRRGTRRRAGRSGRRWAASWNGRRT